MITRKDMLWFGLGFAMGCASWGFVALLSYEVL